MGWLQLHFETADVDLTVVDKEVIDIENARSSFFLQLDPTYSDGAKDMLSF